MYHVDKCLAKFKHKVHATVRRNPDTNRFHCPAYGCKSSFPVPSSLKTHVKKKCKGMPPQLARRSKPFSSSSKTSATVIPNDSGGRSKEAEIAEQRKRSSSPIRSNSEDEASPVLQLTGDLDPTLVDDSPSYHTNNDVRHDQTRPSQFYPEQRDDSPGPSTALSPPEPPTEPTPADDSLSLCYPPNPSYFLLTLLKRLSQAVNPDFLTTISLLCAQNDDDLSFLMSSPSSLEPIRVFLMNQGMNIMEWQAYRRSFFLRSGLGGRDINALISDNSLATFLQSVPTPIDYRIDIFNRLGFYILEDIRLLASLPSQWSTAMNYFISNGLPFAEWLSFKRGLRELADAMRGSKVLSLSADMWTFLGSLRQPLVGYAGTFIEVGLDSIEDVDQLCMLEDQWNAVMGALLRDGRGLSAAECLSLKDGLQSRRSSLRLKSYYEDFS